MDVFQTPNQRELEVSRLATEACEHIISDMGAELHDDLIQRLSIFRLWLDKLEMSLGDRAQAELQIVNMKGEFQEVIQSVRRISRRLMPVKMEGHTFQQAIAILCQNMERPGAGNVHFIPSGEERKLSPLVETHLSRIVQELIHNAYKHSSAWHVWVRLQWQSHHLMIEVEDDGTGTGKMGNSLALLKAKRNTLRMRCDAIGATLHYTPGKKGLHVTVVYPFHILDDTIEDAAPVSPALY